MKIQDKSLFKYTRRVEFTSLKQHFEKKIESKDIPNKEVENAKRR